MHRVFKNTLGLCLPCVTQLKPEVTGVSEPADGEKLVEICNGSLGQQWNRQDITQQNVRRHWFDHNGFQVSSLLAPDSRAQPEMSDDVIDEMIKVAEYFGVVRP